MAPPIYSGTQENTPGTTYSAGAFQGYTGKPGQLFLPANKFTGTGFLLNRNGQGNWQQRMNPSTTGSLVADLGLILSQTLLPPTPNFNGVSYNQTDVGKGIGIAISKVNAFYVVEAGALTSGTIGISKATFTSAVTQAANPTITDILAPTTLTIAGAGGFMSNTSYTPAVTTPLNDPLIQVMAEINAVTPAGVTLIFYGLLLSLIYNY